VGMGCLGLKLKRMQESVLHEIVRQCTPGTLVCSSAGFLASPIGGILSDLTARKWPQVPSARVIPAVVIAASVSTAGAVIYGWTFAYKTHLVGPLIGQAIVGMGCSATLPGIFG